MAESEAQFVKPLWPTPLYRRTFVDIWPGEPPAGAEYIYFAP